LLKGEPNFVSLFAGAGGLDLGLESAGWNCAYASDIDPAAVEALKANVGHPLGSSRSTFESAYIERTDVTKLSPARVLAMSGLKRGGVDLVAGGPPCQSWSSAGRQLGFADPRGRLFDDFIRIANGMDARWLLLENVRGFLTARGSDGQPGSALAAVRRRLLNSGFQTAVGLLNAADFGVPQRRVRLFLYGFRNGDAPPFPNPTHAKEPNLEQRKGWMTLGEALVAIEPPLETEILRPNPRLLAELERVTPGSGLKSPGKSERTRPGGHWGYKQGCFVADLHQSARTVTANSQQDWIKDQSYGVRRLSPRECAAIQGFPDYWRFSGPTGTLYRLIGNAVPPPLAEALGRSLFEHNLNYEENSASFTDLLPLPAKLQAHIRYTAREESSNGESRRIAKKSSSHFSLLPA